MPETLENETFVTSGVPRFIGLSFNRMTPKHQVALPAAYRTACSPQNIADGFVLRKRLPRDRHLNLFPMAEFNVMLDRAREDLETNPDRDLADRLWRAFSAGSHKLSIDTQGRITLPKALLDDVGIAGPDLLFVGCDYRIELWDPEEFKRQALAEEDVERWLSNSRSKIIRL